MSTGLWSQADELIDSLNLVESHEEKSRLSTKAATQLHSTHWERALTYIELAEAEALKTKNPQDLLPSVYIAKAKMYDSRDVWDVSLDYYQQSHIILTETQDSSLLFLVENNMATIYARLQNDANALKYFRRVERYHSRLNDTLRQAQVLNNLGTYYLSKQPDSALYYYDQALPLAKLLKDSLLLGYIYTNIARVYGAQNKSQTALSYHHRALNTAENFSSINLKALVYQGPSTFYLRHARADSSIFYSNKTIALFKDDKISFTLREALHTLYEAHLLQQNYKEASEYFTWYSKVTDSLNI